jgi:aldehyde:ferredoxin oxidoreductase
MEDTYSLLDSFIVCKNAKATFYQELAELAKLYNLVTGIELSADELRLAAERINTLARLINIREGLSRKDDSLPWKVMNEPIPDDGPVKGAFVSQDELDLMLDDYYEARGWTLEGVPKSENLKKLGMDELASLVEGKEA